MEGVFVDGCAHYFFEAPGEGPPDGEFAEGDCEGG